MAEDPISQGKDSGTSTPTPSPKPTFSRAPGCTELYANNVNFESSVWDLHMIFGVFDQTPDAAPFKQLGSVRIPWRQAKIMAYMLAMNIAFHETSNGAINVAPGLAPPDIAKFVEEHFPNDPKSTEMAERINRIRAELGL